MAPKTNPKAVAGNAKKAEVAAAKKAKADQEKEKMETEKWKMGSKDESKRQEAELKRQEALFKKAEREALLAQEEAEHKKAPLIKNKNAAKKESKEVIVGTVPEYSASGLDSAMNLMDLATTSRNTQQKLERHPEKRVKSAYAAFEERELLRLKQENPGLRLSQFKQMLQKMWKKSPENPLNQDHIAYDTSKDGAKMIKQIRQEEALEEFKSK